jgi:hypothetical protein
MAERRSRRKNHVKNSREKRQRRGRVAAAVQTIRQNLPPRPARRSAKPARIDDRGTRSAAPSPRARSSSFPRAAPDRRRPRSRTAGLRALRTRIERQVVPAKPRPRMFSWSFSRPDHHANPSPDRHFCRFDRTRRLHSRGWTIPSGNRRRLVRVQPAHHRVTFLNDGSPLFARLRDISRAI